MTTVTVLLFCHRLPQFSATEFRNYCEEKHVPLMKSLLGPDPPATHTRYYTNKDSGFVIGSPTASDADLVAVITYENQEAMQRSMCARMADGTREKIETDEDKFMGRSELWLVVLGGDSIGLSARDG